MKVIEYRKTTGKKLEKEYPCKWKKHPIGLDSNIEYYEIKRIKKPKYNPTQFSLVENITLTKKKGVFLNIAEISYIKQERSEVEIIKSLDDAIGIYLDSEYPFDRRIKYDTEGTTLKGRRDALGEVLTVDEAKRLKYLESMRDWVKECRQQRKDAISKYRKTGILPEIKWKIKPVKK